MIINILTFSFYPFHNTKLISGYTWGETAETRSQDKKKIKLLLDIFKNNKKKHNSIYQSQKAISV